MARPNTFLQKVLWLCYKYSVVQRREILGACFESSSCEWLQVHICRGKGDSFIVVENILSLLSWLKLTSKLKRRWMSYQIGTSAWFYKQDLEHHQLCSSVRHVLKGVERESHGGVAFKKSWKKNYTLQCIKEQHEKEWTGLARETKLFCEELGVGGL